MCLSMISRRWLAVCLVPAFLILISAPALAEPPPRKPLNVLEGVVVSKKDGQPLADVSIGLAHAEKGWLYFTSEHQAGSWNLDSEDEIQAKMRAEVRAHGPVEKVLMFFPKRNGKTACTTKTDEKGHFRLEGFTNPTAAYHLGVAHTEHGAALKLGIVPKDHIGKELRIEVDEPSYLRLKTSPWSPEAKITKYPQITLAHEPPADESSEKPADPPHVYFQVMPVFDSRGKNAERQMQTLLPGGQRYRVTQQAYAREWAYGATFFAKTIELPPGKTLDVDFATSGGSELSGRVSGLDDKPLQHVNVMVKTAGDSDLLIGAMTDAKGMYKLTGIPPGRHKLELLRYAIRTAPG
ncbi:MAG: carboxypeptidase-like regulatory domain-containing protein [Planctomycetota bacterium]